MTIEKCHSVLVEIDEANNVVRAWRRYADDVPSPFMLLELPLDRLPPDRKRDVASLIGEAVLGGLADAHTALTSYRATDEAAMDAPDMQPVLTAIWLRAMAGEVEAQSGYATILAERAVARSESAYLQEAEDWYQQAALKDEAAAVWFRDAWPRVKQHHQDEIDKRRNAKGT